MNTGEIASKIKEVTDKFINKKISQRLFDELISEVSDKLKEIEEPFETGKDFEVSVVAENDPRELIITIIPLSDRCKNLIAEREK